MEIDKSVDIKDSLIEVAPFLARVQARLDETAWSPLPPFPPYLPELSGELSPMLQTLLAQLDASYDRLWVEEAAEGSWLGRLKRPFHQLAIYYVNKLGRQQVTVNDDMRRLLHQLINENQRQAAELMALRQRIEQLENGR